MEGGQSTRTREDGRCSLQEQSTRALRHWSQEGEATQWWRGGATALCTHLALAQPPRSGLWRQPPASTHFPGRRQGGSPGMCGGRRPAITKNTTQPLAAWTAGRDHSRSLWDPSQVRRPCRQPNPDFHQLPCQKPWKEASRGPVHLSTPSAVLLHHRVPSPGGTWSPHA